MKISF